MTAERPPTVLVEIPVDTAKAFMTAALFLRTTDAEIVDAVHDAIDDALTARIPSDDEPIDLIPTGGGYTGRGDWIDEGATS